MGASLLAKAVDQSTLQCLKERIREQARSHIESIVQVIFVYNPSPLLIKMEPHPS
ncbi:hypothetical protein EMIT0P265_20181 [Pseudomonas zeae]